MSARWRTTSASTANYPGADRELVILVTAREMEACYAWARPEHRAREEGARDEAVAAVRTNGPLDGLSKRERLLIARDGSGWRPL